MSQSSYVPHASPPVSAESDTQTARTSKAASPAHEPTAAPHQLVGMLAHSPRAARQQALSDGLQHSPRMAAQRARIASLGGTQRSAPQSNAAIQRKSLTLPTHGDIWVPDSMKLKPDEPTFGSVANIGGGLPDEAAASSMDVLLTPAHELGSEPRALNNLFTMLPTKGKYELAANKGTQPNGSTLYIKGHLLNDNLGGLGDAENLYPITHQANVDHNQKVEEPIKQYVNREGGAVHYSVQVRKGQTGNTTLWADANATIPLMYANAEFFCTVREFGNDQTQTITSHTATIQSIWGGTDNSGTDKLNLAPDTEHGKASNFNPAEVKIMPRAVAKQAWDNSLLLLAQHLAAATNTDISRWLVTNVTGVGQGGAKLLTSTAGYETLKSAEKGSLTKARTALKKFLNDKHSLYLTVMAGYDDTFSAASTVSVAQVAGQFDDLQHAYDEIDHLCGDFMNLSISSGPSSSSSIQSPNDSPAYGSSSSMTQSGSNQLGSHDRQPISVSAELRAAVAGGVIEPQIRAEILSGRYDILLMNIHDDHWSIEKGVEFYINLFNKKSSGQSSSSMES